MRKIWVLLFLLCLLSCESIIEEIQNNSEQDNYTSPYQGTWLGVYTGSGYNSTFTINVYKSGSLSITRYYDNTSEIFPGQILDNGDLYSVYSQTSGFKLYGSLSTKKGTWTQKSWSGNWTVSKQ